MSSNVLGHLYVIAAPSGTGKTSLVAALIKQIPNVLVSVSHTTRPIRPGESHEKNYFFISEQEFKQKIADKAFLEYAEVFEHFYGTTREWVQQQLSKGSDVILEIDWQGARQIKLSYPEAIGIFILPPTLETLQQRLENRGQDNPAVIAKRLKKAQEEISHHPEYDYLVVNDNFNLALQHLTAIITCRRLTTKNQCQRHANLINSLLHKYRSSGEK